MMKTFKKIISSIIATVVSVSALSISANAYSNFGPYYGMTNGWYAKYTTAIDSSSLINVTLDGFDAICEKNSANTILKYAMIKACILKGINGTSIFNGNNGFNATISDTITAKNEGSIVIHTTLVDYVTGDTLLESNPNNSTTTTQSVWTIATGAYGTTEPVSSFGTMEYRNNVKTLYAYFQTIDY